MPKLSEPTTMLICYHEDNDPSKQGYLERVSITLATMLIEQGVATTAHRQSMWPNTTTCVMHGVDYRTGAECGPECKRLGGE